MTRHRLLAQIVAFSTLLAPLGAASAREGKLERAKTEEVRGEVGARANGDERGRKVEGDGDLGRGRARAGERPGEDTRPAGDALDRTREQGRGKGLAGRLTELRERVTGSRGLDRQQVSAKELRRSRKEYGGRSPAEVKETVFQPEQKLAIAVIGLDRSGAAVSRRLVLGGHEVVGVDADRGTRRALARDGVATAKSYADAVNALPKDGPRTIWLSIAGGKQVDAALRELTPLLRAGDIVVDGGDSDPTESVRRAGELGKLGIKFVDVGAAGGETGLYRGFSLAVGGDASVVDQLTPLFQTLAPDGKGWDHLGPTGTGHWAKAVHDLVETGFVTALAEGLNLIGRARLNAEPLKAAKAWRRGSIVTSFLLDRAIAALDERSTTGSLTDALPDVANGHNALITAIGLGARTPVLATAINHPLGDEALVRRGSAVEPARTAIRPELPRPAATAVFRELARPVVSAEHLATVRPEYGDQSPAEVQKTIYQPERKLSIAMVGAAGRMGSALSRRLTLGGHSVVGIDRDVEGMKRVAADGVSAAENYGDLVDALPTEGPRVVWLMIKAGEPVDQAIHDLVPHLRQGDIIIDGGNSDPNDSVRRAAELDKVGVKFVDVGTSGGVRGLYRGFSLMVGGEDAVVDHLRPIFQTLAPEGTSWDHMGPSGTGHWVKAVHNGIEYAFMAALGEGLSLVEKGEFKADPLRVAHVWEHGSMLSSFLLDLGVQALDADPTLADTSGTLSDSGEGRVTAIDALRAMVPLPTLDAALEARFTSQGKDDQQIERFQNALRGLFGSHPVKANR